MNCRTCDTYLMIEKEKIIKKCRSCSDREIRSLQYVGFNNKTIE